MRLQNHCLKPKARFYGNDNYHLGVELEIEAPSCTARTEGLDVAKRPGWCYAKRDSSLNQYGWELVTHPISRAYWLSKNKRTPSGKFYTLVNSLAGLGYSSHDGGRCGLHVHVSHKAFDGLILSGRYVGGGYCPRKIKSVHLYWFMRLVNGPMFRTLSQRDRSSLDQWCKQVYGSARNFRPSSGRYVATNLTDHTMEVRLFRGNMREDRIRKAVEAVIAAVEFTRGLRAMTWKQWGGDWGDDRGGIKLIKRTDREFAEYVSKRKSLYTNLHAYMVEKGVITVAEDTRIEGVRTTCA